MPILDPVAALEARVRDDGARPLLTCYDLAEGSRVEFSARTFANWVDKTANLLGALGLDEGAEIGLPLLLSNPGHWTGLVWTMATWQHGGTVLAMPRDDLSRVELAVTGPDNAHPVPGVETVVCSLHPLGLGLPAPVAGVTDYAEVLSQPDVHWRAAGLPSTLVDDGTARLTSDDLAQVVPVAGRLLLTPGDDPLATVRDLLLAPLLGGGSVVVVTGGDDPNRLATIAAQEQAQG